MAKVKKLFLFLKKREQKTLKRFVGFGLVVLKLEFRLSIMSAVFFSKKNAG